MRITGIYLGSEDKAGTFADRTTGAAVPWSNTVVSVLDGDAVVRVKVKSAQTIELDGFQRGDKVDFSVTVSANSGERGPYLSTSFDGLYHEAFALAL